MKYSKFDSYLYSKCFHAWKNKKVARYFYCIYRAFRLKYSDPLVKYNNGEYNIILPLSQNLFFYQESYPFFDKRLRIINNYIKDALGKDRLTVIDIGANIGDTILEMGKENRNDYYVAIEREEKYSALIKINLEMNDIKNYDLIYTYLSDSDSVEKYSSICGKGTGKLVKNEEKETIFHTLDYVLQSKNIIPDLVKIDTDGFDFKIMRGAKHTLEIDKPVLYFEYGINDWISQDENIYDVFPYLYERGYRKAIFFDNFGNYIDIIDVRDNDKIEELVNPVIEQSTQIYYYDVLVFPELDAFHMDKFVKMIKG